MQHAPAGIALGKDRVADEQGDQHESGNRFQMIGRREAAEDWEQASETEDVSKNHPPPREPAPIVCANEEADHALCRGRLHRREFEGDEIWDQEPVLDGDAIEMGRWENVSSGVTEDKNEGGYDEPIEFEGNPTLDERGIMAFRDVFDGSLEPRKHNRWIVGSLFPVHESSLGDYFAKLNSG
jgi:hypothetical protein